MKLKVIVKMHKNNNKKLNQDINEKMQFSNIIIKK